MFFLKISTDDDARKAMRLDGGKLKEIQVRLFLSSRAEMQEVIETAQQTTMKLMQIPQRPPISAAMPVTQAVLTPQSPPQAVLTAPSIPPPKMSAVMPMQLPGLITQQMYQQMHQVCWMHTIQTNFNTDIN